MPISGSRFSNGMAPVVRGDERVQRLEVGCRLPGVSDAVEVGGEVCHVQYPAASTAVEVNFAHGFLGTPA